MRLVDARGEIVGRLASRLARALQGKDKPTYSRDGSSGDVVVVVNAGEVALTGKKLREKRYHRHERCVGGLVTRTASEMFDRDPTWVLRKAVERMLPRCVRSKEMMRKLRVFRGEEHGLDEARLVRMEAPPRALKKAPNARIPEGMTPFNPEAFARRVALANRSEEAKSTFARRAALAADARRKSFVNASFGLVDFARKMIFIATCVSMISVTNLLIRTVLWDDFHKDKIS